MHNNFLILLQFSKLYYVSYLLLFIVRNKHFLQMERVLKAVPADLRVKMEALVHDLTLALEESNNSANMRRRWGIRRRARSTGNIRKYKAIKT